MLQWIQSVIASGGYPGLVFLTFIENVFPPIPSELIMPFAGSLARKGNMKRRPMSPVKVMWVVCRAV
jgi:membrane protein DedA with SNARE-associated domain